MQADEVGNQRFVWNQKGKGHVDSFNIVNEVYKNHLIKKNAIFLTLKKEKCKDRTKKKLNDRKIIYTKLLIEIKLNNILNKHKL